jgi:hypothetical protein
MDTSWDDRYYNLFAYAWKKADIEEHAITLSHERTGRQRTNAISERRLPTVLRQYCIRGQS